LNDKARIKFGKTGGRNGDDKNGHFVSLFSFFVHPCFPKQVKAGESSRNSFSVHRNIKMLHSQKDLNTKTEAGSSL
jgi:hypothetical protein